MSKFEHRLYDQLKLRRDEIAVVCLLLLRGPQTTAELRARAERLYAFEDNDAVQSTLERLSAREDPLTRPVGRRWMTLLGGDQTVSEAVEGGKADGRTDRLAALEQQLAELRGRVEALEQR